MKNLTLVALLILMTGLVFAQNSPKEVANHVKQLQETVVDLQDTLIYMSQKIKDLEQRDSTNKALLESNQKYIAGVHDDYKGKFENNQKAIVKTVDVIRTLRDKIATLKTNTKISDLTNHITQLNNPNNTQLGFSLQSYVNKMIKQEIEPNVKRRKGLVEQLTSLTSGLISNFNGIDNAYVNILSGCSNMLNNLVLQKGSNITPEMVNKINKKFNKISLHYQGLENANKKFEVGIHDMDIKIEALENTLKDFAINTATQINPEIERSTLRSMELNTIINNHLSTNKIEETFKKETQKHTKEGKIDYLGALNDKTFQFSSVSVQKASSMADQVKVLSDYFIKILNRYKEDINKTLNTSKTSIKGINQLKIDEQKKILDGKFKKVTDSINNAINHEGTINEIESISVGHHH